MKKSTLRKISLLLVVMLMMSMMVAGCGKKSYAGTWKMTSVKTGDEATDSLIEPYIKQSTILGTLVLKEDGTGTITIEDSTNLLFGTETEEFTWTATDNGFELTENESSETVQASVNGKEATLSDSSSEFSITFEKQ